LELCCNYYRLTKLRLTKREQTGHCSAASSANCRITDHHISADLATVGCRIGSAPVAVWDKERTELNVKLNQQECGSSISSTQVTMFVYPLFNVASSIENIM
jgi:hypothetical protein